MASSVFLEAFSSSPLAVKAIVAGLAAGLRILFKLGTGPEQPRVIHWPTVTRACLAPPYPLAVHRQTLTPRWDPLRSTSRLSLFPQAFSKPTVTGVPVTTALIHSFRLRESGRSADHRPVRSLPNQPVLSFAPATRQPTARFPSCACLLDTSRHHHHTVSTHSRSLTSLAFTRYTYSRTPARSFRHSLPEFRHPLVWPTSNAVLLEYDAASTN